MKANETILDRFPRNINHWNVDNSVYWETVAKRISYNNLAINCFSIIVTYTVWQLFTPITPLLGQVIEDIDFSQLFLLSSLPALAGGFFRFVNTILYGKFNSRTFNIVSLCLTLPGLILFELLLIFKCTNFNAYLGVSFLFGIAGGYIAFSMPLIATFFPKRLKGVALGIAGGFGNLGVCLGHISTITLMYMNPFLGRPWTTESYGTVAPQNIVLFYIVISLVMIVLTYKFTTNTTNDDIANQKKKAKALCDCAGDCDKCVYQFTEANLIQKFAEVFKGKFFWITMYLVILAYGTFLGFSTAFLLVAKRTFPGSSPKKYSWVPPFVGALTRPIGGYLGGKYGNGRITLYTYVTMLMLTLAYIATLPNSPYFTYGPAEGNYTWFFIITNVILAVTGISNGSATALIPTVYYQLGQKSITTESERQFKLEAASNQSSVALGLSVSICAFAGFLVTRVIGSSLTYFGSISYALMLFCACYLIASAMTHYYFVRNSAEVPV